MQYSDFDDQQVYTSFQTMYATYIAGEKALL